MTFAAFGIVCTIICWRNGDWKKWKEYYPTILYFYIGDLVVDYLSVHKQLWAFNGLSGELAILDLAIMALIYPSTTILFLSHYPTKVSKQIRHITLWVGIYTALELTGTLIGDFEHFNGWNMYYSILFNMIMFPLLRLHYKKPLWVWPISIALAFIVLWWFGIPLTRS